MSVFAGPPPPGLLGPIYPITPVIHLTGVQYGYSVITSGSMSGNLGNFFYNQEKERPLSDQWIPLDILPKAGEYITVEQTKSFPAGGPYESGPSYPVLVQALPNPLPKIDVPIPIHTCSDYIFLTNLIPGAWIYVQLDGGDYLVNGVQARKGTEDNFLLDVNVPLPGGKIIYVWQMTGKPASSKDLTSEPTVSTIQESHFSDPLPAPEFFETPRTCYNELAISNILEGASVRAFAPDGNQGLAARVSGLERYKFDGWLPTVVGSGEPGTARSRQLFMRCKLSSPYATSPPIIKTPTLPPPLGEGPVCDDQKRIRLFNLATGNILIVERRVNGIPAPVRDSQIIIDPIPSNTYEFDIPSRWTMVDPAGEVSFVFYPKAREGCSADGSQSSSSVTVTVGKPPDAPNSAPILRPGRAYTCSNLLWVENTSQSSLIQIRDSLGRPLLPRPIYVVEYQKPTFIRLPYRLPNIKDYTLYVEQRGCHSDYDSKKIPVVPYPKPNLPQPEIPDNAWPYEKDTSIHAGKLVVGATVYVIVDGHRYTESGRPWSKEVDVTREEIDIPLNAELKADMKVGVVQYLCGDRDSSNPDPPTKTVRRL